MGIINYLQKLSAGRTDWQGERRIERAKSRNTEYTRMSQWAAEQFSNDIPEVAQDYDDLWQRFRFRSGHSALLVGYKSEIKRKLRHATDMGIGSNPWLSVFLRSDDTVLCVWALLRDESQNYAMMSPFWFLAAGETKETFLKDVMEGIVVASTGQILK